MSGINIPPPQKINGFESWFAVKTLLKSIPILKDDNLRVLLPIVLLNVGLKSLSRVFPTLEIQSSPKLSFPGVDINHLAY